MWSIINMTEASTPLNEVSNGGTFYVKKSKKANYI